MGTEVKYKQALEAVKKLEAHADQEVKRAARVVTGYLKGSPVELGDFWEAMSEGFEFKTLHAELCSMVVDEKVYPLKKPLKVKIQQEENYLFVESPGYRVHGTGDSIGEALRNYMDEFIAHYQWLKSHKAKLAPVLKSELTKIQRLLAHSR